MKRRNALLALCSFPVAALTGADGEPVAERVQHAIDGDLAGRLSGERVIFLESEKHYARKETEKLMAQFDSLRRTVPGLAGVVFVLLPPGMRARAVKFRRECGEEENETAPLGG